MYYQYSNQNEPTVSIIFSPFHEMICSLHVLAKPDHHLPRLSWSEKVLNAMSEDEKKQLHFFNEASSAFTGMLSFVDDENIWGVSIEEILKNMKQMQLSAFYKHFMNEKYSHKEIDVWLLEGKLPEVSDDAVNQVFKRPTYYQSRFISFLENYYKKYFKNDLNFAKPIYIRHLEHQYQVAKGQDIYSYIHDLHPRIENAQDKINFHKYKLFEVYKKDLKEIRIHVTSFIMPHLWVRFEDTFITLVTPIYITSYDYKKAPEDTLKILKSIADETRMQMIKLLYDGPKSTQKVAKLLDLTEACISKHFKVLFEAGIVSKERDGNYMNYHLNVNTIDSLVLMMYEHMSN